VKKGHDKKFVEIILSHAVELRRFAISLCRNEFDADDLVAETVMKAYESYAKLRDKSKVKQWLFRILANKYISVYRVNKRYVNGTGKSDDESFSLFEALENSSFTDEGNPEKDFINMLTREKIEDAVNFLPVDYKTALILCEMEDLSYAEIAVILKVPIGTVRSRIARARNILQKKLWLQAQEMGIQKVKKEKKVSGYVCTCGKEETVNLEADFISAK
jgi:RNA polymerase sigma-70 factor (ECF subfamily)